MCLVIVNIERSIYSDGLDRRLFNRSMISLLLKTRSSLPSLYKIKYELSWKQLYHAI